MINTQYINLNMIPSGVMPVLYCSQYDVGRPLGVVVYNGAESVDLSGYTCTIEATRTDKTPVTAGVTTSGNIGVFETTATMTNQADTYKGKLVLTDGNGKRVASLAFVLVVTVRTMDEDAEEIEEDASLYQQYTGTVQTIIASIRADLAAEITARQNAISTEASTRAAAVSAEAAARQSADNTLQSNINAEASTRATQDASLQSQIDQLIAPSGEAPSAAEVENARIGSDGTVYPTLGDAIRTQNSLLKSHFEVSYTTVDSWEQGGISSSAGTNTASTTRLRTDVFPWSCVSISVASGYKYMIFCYEGDTYKGTWNGSIVQKSATWHTTPINLSVIGNYSFRFVMAKSDDSNITASDGENCTFTGMVDKTLSHKGKAADAFAVSESINALSGKILNASKVFLSVNEETAPGAVTKTGYYCTRASATSLQIKASSTYSTFYFKLATDAQFYCNSDTSIFRLCTIKNGVESESGGEITITGSECTEYNSGAFPDVQNKISLHSGDYIAVCARNRASLTIMMSFDVMVDTLSLSDRQIEQAKNATLSALGASAKSPSCEYADNIVKVYIPTGEGFIRYDFKHDVDASINADVWRINNAFHVDDDYSTLSQLTTSGEWECALHLSGRDDFSGGIAHGDEIVQEITFIVDGNAMSTSDLSTMKDFSILRIVELSKLYDPADHTTEICVHGSEHIFTKDGLTINQNIIWSGTFETTTCYLAMFPPKKNGDDKVFMDTNYALETLPASNYRNVYPGAKSVSIISDIAHFCGTFEVPKYMDESGGNVLWILDNGGGNYHKMYYVVTTGKSVSNGELWKTQTKYRLDVGA